MTLDTHRKIENWPALKIIEHHVPHAQMRDRCARYVRFGATTEACSEFDFVNQVCHVWLSAEFPPPAALVRHERLHCEGYDHVGDDSMRATLRRYLEQTAVAAAGRTSQ